MLEGKTKEMAKSDIFDMLVRYHHNNLQACLPHIRDGVFIDPSDNLPLNEGEENPIRSYKGLLVVANGETLVKDLINDQLVYPQHIVGFVPIKNYEHLFKFLDEQGGLDGAFLYDGGNRTITRVRRIETNSRKLPDHPNLDNLIPDDFVSYQKSLPTTEIGTKTMLAIEIPLVYPRIHSYQIKRTAYTSSESPVSAGSLGLGKVTHFDSKGLAEEFFFRHNPCGNGPFADKENKIEGVHRTYRDEQGNVSRDEGNKIVPYTEKVICLAPKYAKGEEIKPTIQTRFYFPPPHNQRVLAAH